MNYRIAGIVILSIWLSACNQQALPPTSIKNHAKQATESLSTSVLQYHLPQKNKGQLSRQALQASIQNLARLHLERVVTEMLPAIGTQITQQFLDYTTCIRDSHLGADQDQDGYPAVGTYIYDCELADSQGPLKITGTLQITDDNDQDSTSGYRIQQDNLRIERTTGPGEAWTYQFDLEVQSQLIQQTLALAESYVHTKATQATETYDSSFIGQLNTQPNSGDGVLTFDGNIEQTATGGEVNIDLSSPGITLNNSCNQSGIESGTVSIQTNDYQGDLSYQNCEGQ